LGRKREASVQRFDLGTHLRRFQTPNNKKTPHRPLAGKAAAGKVFCRLGQDSRRKGGERGDFGRGGEDSWAHLGGGVTPRGTSVS